MDLNKKNSFKIATIIFGLTLFFIYSYGFSQEPQSLNENGGPLSSNVQISSNEKFIYNNVTHVNTTKKTDGKNGYPEFKYKIDVPPVDDFEFILALDSSGSFADGGDNSQANAVRDAVPEFLREIPTRYVGKNFRVILMSWDQDIDFLYPSNEQGNPFANVYTNSVRLINVANATKDLDKYQIFSKNYQKYYYTKEEEISDINLPIKSSNEIFERIKLNNNNRTSRFLILLTGRGEYWPCDSDTINKSKDLNCSIYVIGMDLLNTSLNMSYNLDKLTDYDSKKFQRLPYASDYDQLKRDLLDALKMALDNAINEPAATNVTVSESFYEYIHPNSEQIRVVERIKNSSDVIYPRYKYSDILDDNKKIRKFTIQLIDGILPNSETTIDFNANLNLKKFPLFYSSESIKFYNYMAETESKPDSRINYLWLKRLNTTNNLPDTPVDIDISSF
jgi:hypothetical protein